MFEAFALFLTIFLLGLAFVVGIALAKVRTLKRITSVMSYTEFRTLCEIHERIVKSYRPLIRPNPATIEQALSFGEKHKLFVGRKCERCDCTREYCLSIRVRRKRKPTERLKAWWDGAWRPA